MEEVSLVLEEKFSNPFVGVVVGDGVCCFCEGGVTTPAYFVACVLGLVRVHSPVPRERLMGTDADAAIIADGADGAGNAADMYDDCASERFSCC